MLKFLQEMKVEKAYHQVLESAKIQQHHAKTVLDLEYKML